MQTIIFSECPPSVNSLYPGRQRRFISKRYKDWIKLAEAEIAKQRPIPVSEKRYGLIVQIAKRRKNSDISNFLKPLEDILVKKGITPDDQNNCFIVLLPMNGVGAVITILDSFECDLLRGTVQQVVTHNIL